MEISSHSTKNSFNEQIAKLIDDMQAGYDNSTISNSIPEFQIRLDKLASAYQDDESLGRIRYKLYEAQAYIHYFQHDNKKALMFIDEAIRVRGETFKSAESLKKLISKNDVKNQDSMLSVKSRPINGLLAWLVFSLGLGVLYNVYQSFTGWGNLNLSPAVNAAYPHLYSLLVTEQVAPILAAIFGITTIVLILQRVRIARTVGICFMAGILIWYVADYSIATSMFANNTAALAAIRSGESSNAHFAFFAVVWLLYLIFSKRVKATLVN
jgi:hypothetical protein